MSKTSQEIKNIFDIQLQKYFYDIENNIVLNDDSFVSFLNFAKDIDIITDDAKSKFISKAKKLRGSYPFATKIIMDEDKILKEGIYTLETIYKLIDDFALQSNMIKESKTLYIAKDDKNALSSMGIFNHRMLIKSDWFTKNVKEWIFIDKSEGNTDMISISKLRKKGVW